MVVSLHYVACRAAEGVVGVGHPDPACRTVGPLRTISVGCGGAGQVDVVPCRAVCRVCWDITKKIERTPGKEHGLVGLVVVTVIYLL